MDEGCGIGRGLKFLRRAGYVGVVKTAASRTGGLAPLGGLALEVEERVLMTYFGYRAGLLACNTACG